MTFKESYHQLVSEFHMDVHVGRMEGMGKARAFLSAVWWTLWFYAVVVGYCQLRGHKMEFEETGDVENGPSGHWECSHCGYVDNPNHYR